MKQGLHKGDQCKNTQVDKSAYCSKHAKVVENHKEPCLYKFVSGSNKGFQCKVTPKTGEYCGIHSKIMENRRKREEEKRLEQERKNNIISKSRISKKLCRFVHTIGPSTGKQCDVQPMNGEYCSKHIPKEIKHKKESDKLTEIARKKLNITMKTVRKWKEEDSKTNKVETKELSESLVDAKSNEYNNIRTLCIPPKPHIKVFAAPPLPQSQTRSVQENIPNKSLMIPVDNLSEHQCERNNDSDDEKHGKFNSYIYEEPCSYPLSYEKVLEQSLPATDFGIKEQIKISPHLYVSVPLEPPRNESYNLHKCPYRFGDEICMNKCSGKLYCEKHCRITKIEHSNVWYAGYCSPGGFLIHMTDQYMVTDCEPGGDLDGYKYGNFVIGKCINGKNGTYYEELTKDELEYVTWLGYGYAPRSRMILARNSRARHICAGCGQFCITATSRYPDTIRPICYNCQKIGRSPNSHDVFTNLDYSWKFLGRMCICWRCCSEWFDVSSVHGYTYVRSDCPELIKEPRKKCAIMGCRFPRDSPSDGICQLCRSDKLIPVDDILRSPRNWYFSARTGLLFQKGGDVYTLVGRVQDYPDIKDGIIQRRITSVEAKLISTNHTRGWRLGKDTLIDDSYWDFDPTEDSDETERKRIIKDNSDPRLRDEVPRERADGVWTA